MRGGLGTHGSEIDRAGTVCEHARYQTNRHGSEEMAAMTTPNGTTRKLDNQAPHLDYYPHWLDNLADDVILQGAVFNGELRGMEQVGRMLSFARSLSAVKD